jgi:hypothetical protein
MANSKAKVQSLEWTLMRFDNPTIASKAHEMAREDDEVASRGQK